MIHVRAQHLNLRDGVKEVSLGALEPARKAGLQHVEALHR